MPPNGPTSNDIPLQHTPDPAHGDLWLAPGVLPSEEPSLEMSVNDLDEYKGVALSTNFYRMLLVADEIARSRSVNTQVATVGIGRLVREYGIDDVERLLAGMESDPDGVPEAQRRMVERIVALENVRNAVAHGVVKTFQLGTVKGRFGFTRRLLEDRELRAAFFAKLKELHSRLGNDVRIFGSQRSFKAALIKALPPRIQTKIEKGDAGVDADREVLYPLCEAAIASFVASDLQGTYTVHKGGLKSNIDGKERSISECLRAAVISLTRLSDSETGGTPADEMARRWLVEEELDGFAFFSGSNSGNPPRGDPYYSPRKATRDDDNGDDGSFVRPLQPPGTPWVKRFVQERMYDRSIGGFPGPVRQVVVKVLNRLLRAHWNLSISDPSLDAALRGQFPDESSYDVFRSWVTNREHTDVFPPNATGIIDYNDKVRGLCMAVTAAAQEMLDREAKKSGSTPPPTPAAGA